MAISTEPTGHGLRVTSVAVRPIMADEESEWDRLMDSHHSLGNARFSGHRIKYVAEHRGRAVALACFSACAYHLADRDRWLGWSDEQATQRRHFVVQNSRFLILPGEPHRNLASRVLAVHEAFGGRLGPTLRLCARAGGDVRGSGAFPGHEL